MQLCALHLGLDGAIGVDIVGRQTQLAGDGCDWEWLDGLGDVDVCWYWVLAHKLGARGRWLIEYRGAHVDRDGLLWAYGSDDGWLACCDDTARCCRVVVCHVLGWLCTVFTFRFSHILGVGASTHAPCASSMAIVRCSKQLPGKGRTCNLPADPGQEFCNHHIPSSERVPCPIDPTQYAFDVQLHEVSFEVDLTARLPRTRWTSTSPSAHGQGTWPSCT